MILFTPVVTQYKDSSQKLPMFSLANYIKYKQFLSENFNYMLNCFNCKNNIIKYLFYHFLHVVSVNTLVKGRLYSTVS